MATRLLERAIEDRLAGERVDAADFRTRMRMGLEAGLVESLDAWIGYRSLRNATSHTYNERKAIEVCAAIPAFVTSATRVLAKLEEVGGAS